MKRDVISLQSVSEAAAGQRLLEYVLWQFAAEVPNEAMRARQALALLLHGVYHSPWQEVAWAFSRLTGDGFPVELTFLSHDRSIRYTTEVAGPERREVERFNCAELLLARLGAKPLPEIERTLFRQVQTNGHLQYGVWIGGRHGPEGDRYKLYIEVPKDGSATAEEWVRTRLGELPFLANRVIRLRMIGYEPGSSRTEFYFRVGELEFWEVALLLRRAGMAAQEAELLALIEEVYNYSGRPVLFGSNIGFSFSISPEGKPLAFSLFTYARSVFGGDDNIRRFVLSLGARRGWNLRTYAALSEPLVGRRDWRTRHGMVAFVVTPEFQPVMHIGLRPPDHLERP